MRELRYAGKSIFVGPCWQRPGGERPTVVRPTVVRGTDVVSDVARSRARGYPPVLGASIDLRRLRRCRRWSRQGRVVQVVNIKTRVESAYGFSA
jgi:hypothetical protein